MRLAVAVEAGTFVLAVILGWIFGYQPLGQIKMSWFGILVGLVATGPMLLAMWWCTKSRLQPLQNLMREVEESIIPLFRGVPPASLLLISILAGLGEECLFRGVVQAGLVDTVGAPIALVVASMLFGLAHLVTPTYALLAGIIGAYLGTLVFVTGDLFAPILSHALYDYVALRYLVRQDRGLLGGLSENDAT